MKWNLKKANWKVFEESAENFLIDKVMDLNIDASLARIREVIIACAKKAIPRGITKNYTPF